MILFNFISIFVFLLIGLYFDIKKGIIPNKYLKYSLLLGGILKIYELINYRYWQIWDIIVILTITFSILFVLFCLNIMRGGDLKVLIIFFFMIPFNYLYYFLLPFFLLILCFIVIIILFNYLINTLTREREGFRLLSSIETPIQKYRMFLLKLSCRFRNITELKDHKTSYKSLKYPYLVYNPFKKKIQILVEPTFSFLIPLILSYLCVLIFIILPI